MICIPDAFDSYKESVRDIEIRSLPETPSLLVLGQVISRDKY